MLPTQLGHQGPQLVAWRIGALHIQRGKPLKVVCRYPGGNCLHCRHMWVLGSHTFVYDRQRLKIVRLRLRDGQVPDAGLTARAPGAVNDWSLTTWDGARREQLRRWSQTPLAEITMALEEMQVLAEKHS